jgi:23S rRNA pseudouridine1911/1915/1917 synthase
MDPTEDPDRLPAAPPGWRWEELTAGAGAAGRRADVWLAARFPHYSRSAVVRQFRAGRIQGIDRPVKASTLLREGERLRFCRPELVSDEPPPPLPAILHEDDRLIAFDKPAGLLVHPAGGRFVWSLVALARLARPGLTLHLVHRLDRDTSGVVVLAKDADANRVLKDAFRFQHIHKVYWALCRGAPAWDTLLVDAPIGDDETSDVRVRMGVVPGGQPARTRLFVLARWPDLCLVAAHPRTGRTHQIRVHLEHVGHPIVGDRIYGQPDALFLHLLDHGVDDWARGLLRFPRQALHARAIHLPHPDGGSVRIVAPLADDLAAVVRAGGRIPVAAAWRAWADLDPG